MHATTVPFDASSSCIRSPRHRQQQQQEIRRGKHQRQPARARVHCTWRLKNWNGVARSTLPFLTGPSRCGTQEMPSLVTTAATHGASKRTTGLAPSREKPSDQRRGPRPAAPGRRRVKDHPNPSHTNPAADRLIRPQRARINRSRQGRRTSSPFPVTGDAGLRSVPGRARSLSAQLYY